MSAVSAPPPATLTEDLHALLTAFGGGGTAGSIRLEASSLAGISREQLDLALPVTVLPARLLHFLEVGWGLRVGPALRARDGLPAALPFLFAAWSVPLLFDGERYQPEPAAVATVADALRGFDAGPSFVLDGLREVVALWTLTAPLPLQPDAARALDLQRRLAARLGADVAVSGDLAALAPLPGGVVRNVGARAPIPVVTFAVVAPERRYMVNEIEAALAGDGARQTGGATS